MDEDRLIKILQTLRFIEPAKEFKENSRAIILALPKNKKPSWRGMLEGFKLGTAIAFAAILLFLVFGGFSLFIGNFSSKMLTSFDENNLLHEAANVDFKIQIGEAKYFDESAAQVAAVLQELSDHEQLDQKIKEKLEKLVL